MFSSVINQFQGSYIKTLFDPVQTHALYGVPKAYEAEAKKALKTIGAKRFRVVNNSFGFAIICFKISL